MDAVSAALGFRVEIRTPLRLRFDEEDKKIVELTSDQAWVLAFVLHRRRAAVTGSGGERQDRARGVGGRTARDRRPPDAAHVLQPQARRAPPRVVGGFGGIDTATFHQLCVQLAKEAGVELPAEEAGPASPYFEHRLPDALAEAADRLGPRYDAIVVDEGQDFREWWWPALLSLHTDPDGGFLYVFADDNQNLYGGALPVGEGTGWDRSRSTSGTRSRSESSSRSSTRASRSRSPEGPRVSPSRSWGTPARTISSTCSRWSCGTWSRRSMSPSRTSPC
jgi:hypothetical protein